MLAGPVPGGEVVPVRDAVGSLDHGVSLGESAGEELEDDSEGLTRASPRADPLVFSWS